MKNQLFFVILVLFVALVSLGASKEDKVLLTIHIPMDNKADTQFGHTVLKYMLFESGFAVNVRDVYNHAHQAAHRKQLTADELEKVKRIVHGLPAQVLEVQKDRSVVVGGRLLEEQKEKVYERGRLPAAMKDLFSLLGGIRFEVQEDLKFVPEE